MFILHFLLFLQNCRIFIWHHNFVCAVAWGWWREKKQIKKMKMLVSAKYNRFVVGAQYKYLDSKILSPFIFKTACSQRLLSTLLIQFKLVYEPFGQSNMQSTLDFCLRPARKENECTTTKQKLRAYCPNICIYCAAMDRTEEL